MLRLSQEVRKEFPALRVVDSRIDDVLVLQSSLELENFKNRIQGQVRSVYSLQGLKDDNVVRKYRDFFWRIGIDPTKIRPASEALIRRVLQGRALPRINTAVDAYNLASMKENIAIGSFDLEKLLLPLEMRFAVSGEEFLGIGMERPKVLSGKEIVISDSERLVAIYPYRDADFSKVTTETEHILSISCGVPGIELQRLSDAAKTTIEYITRFCGGTGSILDSRIE